MSYLILGLFLLTVVFVIVKNIVKFGMNNDTVKFIISDIVRLRGLFFLLFWNWICISMMMQIEDSSKWVLLPFLLCGISAVLAMYEKTKTVAFIVFGMIFFSSIFLGITIGVYNNYLSNNALESLLGLIFMIIVFVILLIFFSKAIYKELKKR